MAHNASELPYKVQSEPSCTDTYVLCRAVAGNMDSEAVEHSIQEAIASVQENILLVERSLLNLEEHTR